MDQNVKPTPVCALNFGPRKSGLEMCKFINQLGCQVACGRPTVRQVDSLAPQTWGREMMSSSHFEAIRFPPHQARSSQLQDESLSSLRSSPSSSKPRRTSYKRPSNNAAILRHPSASQAPPPATRPSIYPTDQQTNRPTHPLSALRPSIHALSLASPAQTAQLADQTHGNKRASASSTVSPILQ